MRVRALTAAIAMLAAALAIIDYTQSSKSGSYQQRTNYELCLEVRDVVNESVEFELLTQSEANTIVERCFTLYGDSR